MGTLFLPPDTGGASLYLSPGSVERSAGGVSGETPCTTRPGQTDLASSGTNQISLINRRIRQGPVNLSLFSTASGTATHRGEGPE